MSALVEVRGLNVTYRTRRGEQVAAADVSFTIGAGESYGLVGESGSGKSTIAFALTRYLPRNARITASEIRVDGIDVLGLDAAGLRSYRGGTLGVVYQEPAQALNPTMTVGAQVAEVFTQRGLSRAEAHTATVAALDRVRLPDPQNIGQRYPHELSGGQQQRAVIAMALATEPALLILDEPTTGLDSRIEAAIMSLIDELRLEIGFATLLISHNLPLVAAHCDRLGVLLDGSLVEEGLAREVLAAPQEEYTRRLVNALPAWHSSERSRTVVEREPLVTVEHLSKSYRGTRALNDVSLTIGRGEILGIVGESGSGKSTLGRCLAGIAGYDGSVVFADQGARVQMVFQNPDGSLNPRHTVRKVLTHAVRRLGGTRTAEELAAAVGLAPTLLDSRPAQLSGGQKQRVAIARAFAGEVPLVICDEPTSALDVSVQAVILDLLRDLQRETGVSLVLVSHDLAVVRSLADRIAVLHEGVLVEIADSEALFEDPQHEYTRSLVDAAAALRGERVG